MTMTTPDTSFTMIETMLGYVHESDTELRLYDDTTSTDYQLFLKLPVTLGDTWVPHVTEPTITRTVLSLSASITVPAGSFTSCANLRDLDSSEPGFYIDVFLSGGSGIIKSIASMTHLNNTMYIVSELNSSIIN